MKKRKESQQKEGVNGACQMPFCKEKVVSSNPPKPNSFGNQILSYKFGIYKVKDKEQLIEIKEVEVVYLKRFFSNRVCHLKSCQVTFGK